MVEFKIQLEESLVQTLGYQEVEKRLEDFAQKLILKSAAQDILEDLQTIDLKNDKKWQETWLGSRRSINIWSSDAGYYIILKT